MSDIKKLKELTKDMKVLYVEDDKLVRKEIKEYFEKLFFKVDTADNGEEGLEAYNKGEYDLVVTDINMPKMNGIEMSKAILKSSPNQSIVIISAHNESQYLLELFKAGIEYYILKPFTMEQLIKIISKVAYSIKNKKIVYKYNDSNIYTDPLSGLKNLSSFMHDIVAVNNSKNKFRVLILLDIDNMQGINDLYGIEIGNKVITDFSLFLKKYTDNKSYKLYHATGDQFILLDNVDYIDTEKYEKEFEELQNKIKSFNVYLIESNKKINVNATIGMSLGEKYPFERADMALKNAKEKHLSYIVYNKMLDTTQESVLKIEWQNRIIRAIEKGQIIPVYQPIVDKNGDILKYEALMRLVEFENSEEKLISPVDFLDTAIQSKYYDALSSIMIHKVFDALNLHKYTISINLSYIDVLNKVFIDGIYKRIKKERIGDRIVIEILESENIQDYKIIKSFIDKFRQLGVKIAIDDFGSGYSNFKHILEIHPDYIKIDQSIIKNIDIDSHAFIMTEYITTFFHKLNVKIIAEHVHTKEIYSILKQFNIDEFQGYYFSKPIKKIW